MKARQAKAATYIDKKMIDSELKVGDKALIYLPRLETAKLKSKWIGPFEIVRNEHPCYETNVENNMKWLPRDRLRKVTQNFSNSDLNPPSEPNISNKKQREYRDHSVGIRR